MNITYYGHSCFMLNTNGKNILVDPFITANPVAASIDINTLTVDYILLTHAHYDHVIDVESIASRTKAKIIGSHEVVTYYGQKGFEGHPMNQGGSWDFDFGRLKAVNAVHSSSFPDGSYGGNPLGFVLQSEGKTIYIAGDTALTFDMKLIPLFFQLDIAILPIGGNFTMDVQEAVIAAEFLECSKVIGVHYDTSPQIAIDHEAAKKQFKAKNQELILLNLEEKYSV